MCPISFESYFVPPLVLGAVFFLIAFNHKGVKENRKRFAIFLGNVVLTLLLISLVLVAGEGYCRFFWDSTDSLGYSLKTRMWYQQHWRVNSIGCRDSIEYPREVKQQTRRITFLGDSFTAGHGINDVENRFANIIRASHPDWEIQVLANPGLDTGGELDALQVYCQTNQFQLDIVILVYCLNDISDLLVEWQELQKQLNADLSQAGWVRRNSVFLDMLYCRYRVSADPRLKDYFSIVKGAYEGQVWERQKKRLRDIKKMVESCGGRFGVVTFPFLHAVNEYQHGFAHEQLGRFWEGEGVKHLDLLRMFGESNSERLTLNRFDAHPNEYAHRLVACEVESFISSFVTTVGKTNLHTILR